jgi:GNAT superfamily N-acetyltransferase
VSRVNVRVRPAERADLVGLVELTRSVDLSSGVFSGKPLQDQAAEHLAARLDEILSEGARHLLVAVDDTTGSIVGLLVAKPDEIGAIDITPVLHVTHLLVSPKHRRRGVGRALLAGAVHLADELGVDRVLGTAASGSREANRYLARLGFAPLVVHRIASTSALRRGLGMSDAPERLAVLRRARLARAQRSALAARVIGRGA